MLRCCVGIVASHVGKWRNELEVHPLLMGSLIRRSLQDGSWVHPLVGTASALVACWCRLLSLLCRMLQQTFTWLPDICCSMGLFCLQLITMCVLCRTWRQLLVGWCCLSTMMIVCRALRCAPQSIYPCQRARQEVTW